MLILVNVTAENTPLTDMLCMHIIDGFVARSINSLPRAGGGYLTLPDMCFLVQGILVVKLPHSEQGFVARDFTSTAGYHSSHHIIQILFRKSWKSGMTIS